MVRRVATEPKTRVAGVALVAPLARLKVSMAVLRLGITLLPPFRRLISAMVETQRKRGGVRAVRKNQIPDKIWALRVSSVRPIRQRERLQYKFATGVIEDGRSTNHPFSLVRGSVKNGSSRPAISPCFRFSLAVVRSREHAGPIPPRAYNKSLGGESYVLCINKSWHQHRARTRTKGVLLTGGDYPALSVLFRCGSAHRRC